MIDFEWDLDKETEKLGYLEPDIGEKEGIYMKKRKKNRDSDYEMPIGELRKVKDFLPPPSELAKAKTVVRVTIDLDQASIKFLKNQAKKHGTKYQRMIREILSRYVANYKAA